MKQINNIGIIGLGLIGGSMALVLKEKTKARILGMDSNPVHLQKAMDLGIIDSSATLSEIVNSDVVIIAVPVDKIPEVSISILDKIQESTLVFDVGSTKHRIGEAIKDHPRRGNFVAAHPIAGTEFSGPEAALPDLFINKKNIVCDRHLTSDNILKTAIQLFELLDMQTSYMDSKEHDKHIAYVSHLSHISSFMLGKTVMEIEKDERNIFNMAGSGFESTVRLAKSSPASWTPIFVENKDHILKSLEEYIRNLNQFAQMIKNENEEELFSVMQKTNHITEILNK